MSQTASQQDAASPQARPGDVPAGSPAESSGESTIESQADAAGDPVIDPAPTDADLLAAGEGPPSRCLLNHQLFSALGRISFRRAETDGTPVMVISLGEREAAVPLRALQREFGIEDDSPDGRMLGLIAEALDYVAYLHLGDRLPSEVLDGTASWDPEPRHRALVENRLRMQLLAWLDPASLDSAARGAAVARLDEDATLRHRVHRAFEQAARELGLPDAEAVIALVENLANELSYIEALRDGLLRRVQLMTRRVAQAVSRFRGDGTRLESLTQVHRLGEIARNQIAARFDEVDAQTGEVMAALRNIESQQAFIRSNRDLLYRSLRGWEPILADWETQETLLDESFWALIGRTYHFLAPRYMPVQEWHAQTAARPRRGARPGSAMAW